MTLGPIPFYCVTPSAGVLSLSLKPWNHGMNYTLSLTSSPQRNLHQLLGLLHMVEEDMPGPFRDTKYSGTLVF